MSIPGRATVTRQGYAAYIQSSAWRKVRQRYWNSKLPKECWVCGAPRTKGFHLHHRTYKNLGNEYLRDLVPVCPKCHDYIHSIQKYFKWDLWRSTRQAKIRYNKMVVPAINDRLSHKDSKKDKKRK